MSCRNRSEPFQHRVQVGAPDVAPVDHAEREHQIRPRPGDDGVELDVRRCATGELVLDPDEFYILVSKEEVHVPPDFAAEMEKVFLSDSEHCEELTSPEWRERHPMARVAEVLLVPLRPLL